MSFDTSAALQPLTTGIAGRRLMAMTLVAFAMHAGSPAESPAAQRHASPSSTITAGTCPAATPCRIDHAIGGALTGDEVIVAPGDYTVNAPLQASNAIEIHGPASGPRPRLLGSNSISAPTLALQGGGSVHHLQLEATHSTEPALEIGDGGGTGEHLVLISLDGAGAEVHAGLTGSILRDSVVRSLGSGRSALEVQDGALTGTIDLRNLTVMATGSSSVGIHSTANLGVVTAKNTIARGASKDVQVGSGANFTATHSNIRSAMSSGTLTLTFNQSAAPRFVNEATGDFHVIAGSPTIDAGLVDPLSGLTDLDGVARGLTPDIGAFEYVSGGGGSGDDDPLPGGDDPLPGGGDPKPGDTPDGGSDQPGPTEGTQPRTQDGLPAAGLSSSAAPVLGRRVSISPAAGQVTVTLPGSSRPRALNRSASIPVGSTVNASRGSVRLKSVRDSSGATQTGTFSGGAFRVRQARSRRPVTELVLIGGDFRSCRAPAATGRQASTAWGRRRAYRRLWGRDRGGRFRTVGRHGSAAVRGTVWLTEDTCAGTKVTVREGAVLVRDRLLRKNVLVRAGRSHLARASRARRG